MAADEGCRAHGGPRLEQGQLDFLDAGACHRDQQGRAIEGGVGDRDDFGGPAWILRSFRFDKDKLAETKETRGDGKEPPADAFK